MKKLNYKSALVVLVILGFLACFIGLYQQNETIKYNQHTLNYFDKKLKEKEEDINEYNQLVSRLREEISELTSKNEILMSALSRNSRNHGTYSRYIQLNDGSLKWVTYNNCEDYINLLNLNFCMHQSTRIPY